VIQFALFNFLNIFTASNRLTQNQSGNLEAKKQAFVGLLQENVFVWWLQKRINFVC